MPLAARASTEYVEAILRDRRRLDQATSVLAKIPPERRGAMANGALALPLQYRDGRRPLTYLATTPASPSSAPALAAS